MKVLDERWDSHTGFVTEDIVENVFRKPYDTYDSKIIELIAREVLIRRKQGGALDELKHGVEEAIKEIEKFKIDRDWKRKEGLYCPSGEGGVLNILKKHVSKYIE